MFALVGATGTGKTAVSLAVAKLLDGEIVCGDSRQVFAGLDAASGKPTLAEREYVPHHLFDRFDLRETVNAGRYAEEAAKVIGEIQSRDRLPVVVGGSGFYLKALYEGLAPIPEIPEDLRRRIRGELATRGPGALHRELQSFDPVTAQRLEPGDGQRIARALEVVRGTGKSLSEWHEAEADPGPLGGAEWTFVGLKRERDSLYAVLDQRTRAFFEGDLEREVRGFLEAGVSSEVPGLQSLGYRHFVAFIEGQTDWESALTQARQATRNYAKRQMTWWRKEGPQIGLVWFSVGEKDAARSISQRIARYWLKQQPGRGPA